MLRELQKIVMTILLQQVKSKCNKDMEKKMTSIDTQPTKAHNANKTKI